MRSRSTASRSTAIRPDLVAKYPTHDDKMAFWRLPTLYKSCSRRTSPTRCTRSSRCIMTSGRLVEYEGGGEETRSNPWLAELQQEMFIEINPKVAAEKGIRNGERAWVQTPTGARAQRAGAGDRAGRAGHGVHARSTSPVTGRARTCWPTTRRARADGARRGDQHRHHLRLRQRDHDAGNQDDGLQRRASGDRARKRKRPGSLPPTTRGSPWHE